MFKKLGTLTLGLALLLAGCGKEKSTLELRWRFVGAEALRRPTAPAGLRGMLTAPQSAEVANRLVTNSAQLTAQFLNGLDKLDGSTFVALQPLVDDVLSHESVGEIWRSPEGKRIALLGVRVTKERADIWVRSWTALWSKLNGVEGLVSVSADQGWLFAVSDLHAGSLPEFKKLVLEKPAPTNSVLSAEGGIGFLNSFRLDVISTNGRVKINSHFSAPSLAVDKPVDWAVPASIVRDPLISFTAMRGWSPQLVQALGLTELLPDEKLGQLYAWGNNGAPIQSGVAIEMLEPARFGARAANAVLPKLQSTNNPRGWGGHLYMDTNTHSVSLVSGILNPTLVPLNYEKRKYAVLAFAPPPHSNSPPPMELVSELGKPGTLYYDWEITSENAEHWGAILSSWDALRLLAPPGSRSPAQQWLWGCSSNLVNTATRITQTTPGEFELARTSDGGLSGMELVLFSRWIDPPQEIRSKRRGAVSAPGLPR